MLLSVLFSLSSWVENWSITRSQSSFKFEQWESWSDFQPSSSFNLWFCISMFFQHTEEPTIYYKSPTSGRWRFLFLVRVGGVDMPCRTAASTDTVCARTRTLAFKMAVRKFNYWAVVLTKALRITYSEFELTLHIILRRFCCWISVYSENIYGIRSDLSSLNTVFSSLFESY